MFSGSEVYEAGISTIIQCFHGPFPFSKTMEKVFVPAGGFSHCSSGDISEPRQPNLDDISPPFLNEGLVKVNFDSPDARVMKALLPGNRKQISSVIKVSRAYQTSVLPIAKQPPQNANLLLKPFMKAHLLPHRPFVA
jgi:hypothetical protein